MKSRNKSETNNLERNWRREYSIAQVYGYAVILRELLVEYLDHGAQVRCEGSDGWVTVFSVKGSVDCLVAEMRRRLENEPESYQADLDDLHKTGIDLVAFASELRYSDEISTEQLISGYESFFKLFTKHSLNLFETFYYVEAGGQIFEEMVVKHVPRARQQEAVDYYSRPSGKAHVLKMAEQLRTLPDRSAQVVYIKEYYPWVLATDICTPEPTDQQYSDFAQGLSNVGLESDKKVSKFDLSDDALNVVAIYQDVLFLKDKRDEYRRRSFYEMKGVVDEIISRLSISRRQLWHIRPAELVDLARDKNWLADELPRRQQGYLLELGAAGENFWSGSEALSRFVVEDMGKESELRGTVGSVGIATGIVQKVKLAEDVANFGQGKILVATTTNPVYVMAMGKAAAIVTDEGGLTSHAAIVSRELGIPCIVGTKRATQVLNDGDMVEVDADKGIVRKI